MRRTSRKWLSRRLRTRQERDSSGESAGGVRLMVSGPALQSPATVICVLLVLDRGTQAEVTQKGDNVLRVSPGRSGNAMDQGPNRGGTQGWGCNHHFGGLHATRVWPESPVLWDPPRFPGCSYPEWGFLRALLRDTGGRLRHKAAACVAWKSLLPCTPELLPLAPCSSISSTRLQSFPALAAEGTSSSSFLKYLIRPLFSWTPPGVVSHTALSPLLAVTFASLSHFLTLAQVDP